jgi:hypothetical protein
MFDGDRPKCPRGCPGRVHRHGRYRRYSHPSGPERFVVWRFRCPRCRLTISVLPADRLPYRPLCTMRTEAFFNQRASVGTGPRPAPSATEAGCLWRAWHRFRSRASMLAGAVGVASNSHADPAALLWSRLTAAWNRLADILSWLALWHGCSLLGDYRCLRVPP